MDNSVKNIIDRFKISEEDLDKIFYSCLKLILYKKKIALNLYEPNIDIKNGTVELINVQTCKNEFREVFGRRAVLQLRNYIDTILRCFNSENNCTSEIYQLAKLNSGSDLERIIEDINKKYSIPPTYTIKEIQHEPLDEPEPEKERDHFIPDNARYCGVCEERPCMCSDPDPG